MIVGIIPARGDSTGVPLKNSRLLGGKTLVERCVKTALQSTHLSKVFVSTNSEDIGKLGLAAGATVIRHPSDLSTPTSPTAPVIAWAVNHLEAKGLQIEIVAIMRATTPFISAIDIDTALGLLIKTPRADSIVSVTDAKTHPVRLKRISEEGWLRDAFEAEGRRPRRRQELERLYTRNGGIYAARRGVISSSSMWGEHCLAYLMPEERSVNINTEFDLKIAQLLADDVDKLNSADGMG